MEEDINISTNNYNFKLRVSGLLTINDKFLVVEMNDSGFFCLPGGHVELGETTENAVLRELEEEIGFPVVIKKYLGVTENYFINSYNKKMHEICFYYLLMPKNIDNINENDYQRIEIDHGYSIKMNFKWVTNQTIKEIDIRPTIIKDLIVKNNLDFKHLIINDLK